jgi:hypothetical protein
MVSLIMNEWLDKVVAFSQVQSPFKEQRCFNQIRRLMPAQLFNEYSTDRLIGSCFASDRQDHYHCVVRDLLQ